MQPRNRKLKLREECSADLIFPRVEVNGGVAALVEGETQFIGVCSFTVVLTKLLSIL